MGESAATNDPPFDLQGLHQLYGEETVAELLQMSVDEARGLLAEIHSGIESRDSKAVMMAAHQLKGLAATMTINELSAASLALETAAKQSEWDAMPPLETRLKKAFEHTSQYIAQILNS